MSSVGSSPIELAESSGVKKLKTKVRELKNRVADLEKDRGEMKWKLKAQKLEFRNIHCQLREIRLMCETLSNQVRSGDGYYREQQTQNYDYNNYGNAEDGYRHNESFSEEGGINANETESLASLGPAPARENADEAEADQLRKDEPKPRKKSNKRKRSENEQLVDTNEVGGHRENEDSHVDFVEKISSKYCENTQRQNSQARDNFISENTAETERKEAEMPENDAPSPVLVLYTNKCTDSDVDDVDGESDETIVYGDVPKSSQGLSLRKKNEEHSHSPVAPIPSATAESESEYEPEPTNLRSRRLIKQSGRKCNENLKLNRGSAQSAVGIVDISGARLTGLAQKPTRLNARTGSKPGNRRTVNRSQEEKDESTSSSLTEHEQLVATSEPQQKNETSKRLTIKDFFSPKRRVEDSTIDDSKLEELVSVDSNSVADICSNLKLPFAKKRNAGKSTALNPQKGIKTRRIVPEGVELSEEVNDDPPGTSSPLKTLMTMYRVKPTSVTTSAQVGAYQTERGSNQPRIRRSSTEQSDTDTDSSSSESSDSDSEDGAASRPTTGLPSNTGVGKSPKESVVVSGCLALTIYECSVCHNVFPTKQKLDTHEEEQHKHSTKTKCVPSKNK